MGKKIFGTAAAVVLLVLLWTGSALADGGLFGKDGRDIYEPEQKAVVFFQGGTEELVLSVHYGAAAEEFAWLVPTPEPPQIAESDIALFRLMSAFTPGNEQHGWGMRYLDGLKAGMENGVDVLEERTVGAYDVSVVRSDDAGALKGWLEERGFDYDDHAEEVLKDYMERGWCFTAMRIDPSMAAGVGYDLLEGTIDPLRFTFNTSRPVYPLYISSLNPGMTEVLLYVIGDQPYHHEDMVLEYAERWQPVQVAALEAFSDLAGKMENAGGCYVTKLRREHYYPDQMQDLYLTAADQKTLEPWTAGLVDYRDGGGYPVTWWVAMTVALLLALLFAAILGFMRCTSDRSMLRALSVFIVAVLLLAGTFLSLGIKVYAEDNEESHARADWPWKDDILISQNGWQKVIHPDGRSELLGLDENLKQSVDPTISSESTSFSDPFGFGHNLDDSGDWRWAEDFQRNETTQTKFFVANSSGGEELKVEIGMKEIHDARLSPQGDRLWIAMNPGVPVNVTEVQEYGFPSLTLRRSIIHPYCLRMGGIVMDEAGEPLLAGCYDRYNEGDTGWSMDMYIGFLPLLEENAEFRGEYLSTHEGNLQNEDNYYLRGIFNSYFCDALDGSSFLLLSGNDYGISQGTVYVLDTRDGELYEVENGYPVGWR